MKNLTSAKLVCGCCFSNAALAIEGEVLPPCMKTLGFQANTGSYSWLSRRSSDPEVLTLQSYQKLPKFS